MSGCKLHLIEPTTDTHNNYHRSSFLYQFGNLVQVLLCRVNTNCYIRLGKHSIQATEP